MLHLILARRMRTVIAGLLFVTIFHWVKLSYMKTSHSDELPEASEFQKVEEMATSATSGKLFKITKTRSIDPTALRFQTNQQLLKVTTTNQKSLWPTGPFWNKKCKHWGTITSIFNVTKATVRVARMSGWCLVVAGDRKGPGRYEIPRGQVVFLSHERQEELAQHIPFVQRMPWNHFARKNVAYLYAIANGAEYIWDFDDDNDLMPGKLLNAYTNQDPSTPQQVLQVDNRNNTACQVYNPYAFFQPSALGIWPRGYPLEKLHDAECQLVTKTSTYCTRGASIGIWQSLANGDPDVDGIFRLTRGNELPVNFAGTLVRDTKAIIVPQETLSPMNAQAALFHQSAFWSLFLPTTVHGRVGDIWRSYFAQTLLKLTGIEVAFVGPLVTQARNPHNSLADMNAEQPLYERAGVLAEFLLAWKEKAIDSTLEGSMERLYADLYEYGILEWNDIGLVQDWLALLQALDYPFPKLQKPAERMQSHSCLPNQQSIHREAMNPETQATRMSSRHHKYSNVVLVGQFNWNLDASYVMHWVNRWSEFFEHVHVRGPFNNTNIMILEDNNVHVVKSANDAGYYSPMKNLADTLRLVADDATIVGVMITHDDLIFNLTQLEALGFPSKTEILSQAPPETTDQPYLYFTDHSTFRKAGSDKEFDVNEYQRARLKGWRWWKECIPGFANATSRHNLRRSSYTEQDGTVGLYANSPGDFAYVPTKYTAIFADMADWLVENRVFLEVGFPTLIGHLQNYYGAKAKLVEYCTVFDSNRPHYAKWIPYCSDPTRTWSHYYPSRQKPSPPWGLFHPIKLTAANLSVWDQTFDYIHRELKSQIS